MASFTWHDSEGNYYSDRTGPCELGYPVKSNPQKCIDECPLFWEDTCPLWEVGNNE